MKRITLYLPGKLPEFYEDGIELIAKPSNDYNQKETAEKVVEFLSNLPAAVITDVLRNSLFSSDIKEIYSELERKVQVQR